MDSDSIVGCFIILVIVAMLGLVALSPFIRFSSTGDGAHNGYITAVQQDGFVFRNYRVFVKTDNSSSQEDEYCVNRDNAGLISQLQQASTTQQRVQVSFHGVRGIGLGLCQGQEISTITADTK